MKKVLITLTFAVITGAIFAADKTAADESVLLMKTRSDKKVPDLSDVKNIPWNIDFELSCGSYYGAQYTPAPNATMEQIFADLDAWANYYQNLFCGGPGNPTWINY